jgi:diguanylate cyclase (GGDEF)-like protein
MRISGTFLNSKVAKRIALVLFLASFIPTVLVTFLAQNTIKGLTKTTAHRQLVETSKSHALFVFSNLVNARNVLNENAQSVLHETQVNQQTHQQLSHFFQSIVITQLNGSVIKESGAVSYSTQAIQAHIQTVTTQQKAGITHLLVVPSRDVSGRQAIILARSFVNENRQKILIFAELNPRYLWGNQEDYPSDIRVCAFEINSKTVPLFCSNNNVDPIVKQLPENMGEWELFLGGEFRHTSWRFETNRTTPFSHQSAGFFDGYGYTAVALMSLLLVALLSTIQIRRTMVPLEQLIQAARNIATGQFKPVSVNQSNEFGELAEAFNQMSSHIERQLDTLQTLAMIDQEIASHLNVEKLIHQIINRMALISAADTICITHLVEEDQDKAHCKVFALVHNQVITHRGHITMHTITDIKKHENGLFCSTSTYQDLFKDTQQDNQPAQFAWLFPILWQGKICAFVSLGSHSTLQQNAPFLDEMKELANRVGIAITAEAREHQLMVQAQYDSLTGLPNRVLLNDRILQAIEVSNRINKPFWLAFIDMDKFKFVNDSFGHHIGDQFLCEIAKRLERAVRGMDTVARFGGDEFIVLLQADHDEQAKNAILQRIMQTIIATVNIQHHEILTSCSIGVAAYPSDGLTPEELLTHADIALYRAKELGRNNIQEFNPIMNQRASMRLKMETQLRKALENKEFTVFYQPKTNLISQRIVGMEALVRWHNPLLGFISPQAFIPLAEETGLIISLGEWVLKTACEQAVAWQQAGYQDLLMSVNFSARQLAHSRIIEQIEHVLAETGLKPHNLELELTESMIMNNAEETIQVLQKIKSLGVHLSIDDFGTGYSSLAYLQSLPVDTLKIDKIFIDDIESQESNAPIVASVIALAKNLQLKVVAEGVETQSQIDYLKNHGCDEVQGYFYGKPEPATQLVLKLSKKRQPSRKP